MHLFRSVFVIGAAALTFMVTEAPQASAWVLPMTRYMLDAVPECVKAPAGSTLSDGTACADLVSENASASPDVPTAVDTPVVSDKQGQAGGSPAASGEAPRPSSVSDPQPSSPSVATTASVDLAAAASSVAPPQPSIPPDTVLAQTNGAYRVIGLGGPGVLAGSMLATVLFVL